MDVSSAIKQVYFFYKSVVKLRRVLSSQVEDTSDIKVVPLYRSARLLRPAAVQGGTVIARPPSPDRSPAVV